MIALATRQPLANYPLRSGLPKTLGDIAHCTYSVHVEAPLKEVIRTFEAHADFPGAIVIDGVTCVGVVSRRRLYEQLGRPYGVEVFSRRSIRAFISQFQMKPHPMPTSLIVEHAVQQALHRPVDQLYEPVLAQDKIQYRLIDLHDLLLTHAGLLTSANAIIHNQVSVEQRLFAILDWKEVVSRIFFIANDLVAYDCASLWWKERDQFHAVAEYCPGTVPIPVQKAQAMETFSQAALPEMELAHAPILRLNVHKAQPARPPRPDGYDSWLGMPFLHEQRVIGLLALYRHSGKEISPDEILLLENFCRQAVIALRNAEQFRAGGCG